MCAAFSSPNSTVFAFLGAFNRRFCRIHQNHLIFHITFQWRFPPWQRKCPISDQRIFYPLNPTVDIALRDPVAGRYMGVRYSHKYSSVASSRSSMPSFGVLPRHRCFWTYAPRNISTIFSNVARLTPVIRRNCGLLYSAIISYFICQFYRLSPIFARGLM